MRRERGEECGDEERLKDEEEEEEEEASPRSLERVEWTLLLFEKLEYIFFCCSRICSIMGQFRIVVFSDNIFTHMCTHWINMGIIYGYRSGYIVKINHLCRCWMRTGKLSHIRIYFIYILL